MKYIHKATKGMHISQSTVIALGNFDGIHSGHRKLISSCKELAKEARSQSLVFSFYPHPSHVISGLTPVPMIYTRIEKKHLLESLGIDYYVEYPFDMQTAQMEPTAFIKDILVEQFNVRGIVVGSNYNFGYKRKGDINLLKEYSKVYGYELLIIDDIRYYKEMVSSTQIRKHISNGQMEKANALLTSPYFIEGEVIYGKQLGRKLGFPTMNIKPEVHKQYPAFGVYVTKTYIGNKVFESVTNVGYNPTVDTEQKLNIETYIIDFNDEIYGKNVKIEFMKKLRDEMNFPSLDDLILQMKNDVKSAKQYFEIWEDVK